MSTSEPRGPAEGNRPHVSEPAEMSLAEKLACEREARHDVVGRRRVGDVAPLQHYLTHSRTEDGRRPAGEHRPHPHSAPSADTGSGDPISRLRSWMRWGED